MISQLCGEIVATGDGFVVLDVGGVGYRVNMTTTDILSLSSSPGKKTVHTHLIVREDALTLYGFLDTFDLEVFQLLIAVNRVGPQLALSILSQVPAKEFVQAVTGEDEKRLTRLSGIGPRNAKRLILELKDRMKERLPVVTAGASGVAGNIREDVADALVALGFPPRESYDAVDETCRITGPADSQVLLKASLLHLKERKKR
ncbi:MAG: Holliday junction branch migration protein RuvA [Methanomicrobiales archaeon]|nr:Holliday junction branch migration protein RuvA [Methanomicrobiales archaeon]